jgi:hypothetical protein
MLNGNTTTNWNNVSNSGQTVVLAVQNYARASDTVQVYWPVEKTFDRVSLFFTTDSTYSIPATLKVQYWDGFAWVDAARQIVIKASASNAETIISFDPVVSRKVRVFMESTAPLANSGGRIAIVKFEASWGPRDITQEVKLSMSGADTAITARITNYTPDAVTGNLYIAIYDLAGRLVSLESKSIANNGNDAFTISIPSGCKGYSVRAFAWDNNYVPITMYAAIVLQ